MVPDPLLVAQAGFRSKPETAGRVANRRSVKDRRFEDHPRRALPHLRGGAAHDSGQADGVIGIGDHQHSAVERAPLVVQGLELLAVPGAAHHDRPVRNRVGVVRMHRLAQLVHHVVGDVHHRADRPHPGGQQAALHPRWRRPVHAPPSNQRAAKRGQPSASSIETLTWSRPAGRDPRRPTYRASAPMSRPGRRPRGPGRPSTARRRGWA